MIATPCPQKTGTRTQVQTSGRSGMPEDLPALVAELLLLVGLARAVVDDGAGHREDVVGDRLSEDRGRRELDGVAGEREQRSCTIGGLLHLLVELADARQAGAGDGLVGRDDDPAQPRSVVDRARAPASRPSPCSSGWRRSPSGCV